MSSVNFPIDTIQRGRQYLLAFQGYDSTGITLFHGYANQITPRLLFRDSTTRNVDQILFAMTDDGNAKLLQPIPGASIPRKFKILLDNPFLFYLDPSFSGQLIKSSYIVELSLSAQYTGTNEFSEIILASSTIQTIGQLNNVGLA